MNSLRIARLALRPTITTTTMAGRSFSIIGDALGKFTTNRVENTKEKNFAKMVDTMISNPNWTFRPWKQIMEEQLGSWMMYIPGMGSSQDVKEMKGMKEMLDAMTPEELDNPSLINGQAKQRIAQVTGKPVDQVLMLCFLHKQSSVVAKWLHMKKESGEPMPKTDVDMKKMMENDPRVRKIASSVMNPNGARKTGRNRRMF